MGLRPAVGGPTFARGGSHSNHGSSENDAEEIDAEIAADNERADSLGLILDSDPRKVAKTGAAQAGAQGLGGRLEGGEG